MFKRKQYKNKITIERRMFYNMIKINEVSEGFSNLEVKKYLSFGIKHTIIKNVLESSTVEENGIMRIDFAILEMVKLYSIINNYTNLDFTEGEVLDLYDQLMEQKIIEFVLKVIPSSELEFFDKVISQEINQIQKLDNSIEGIVAKGLNQLIVKLPDEKNMNKLIKEIPKQLNKISPDAMNFLADTIGWNTSKQTNK